MSQPSIPPRPQRNNQAGPTVVKNDTIPLVPPRPVRQRDISSDRESSTRSPLNMPPTAYSNKTAPRRTSQELPRRPPSVSLPTLGHDGEEYSSFDQLPDEAHGVKTEDAGEQTRNVAADLPMHQPKASVPQSTATKNIQKVTETDSAQAAAAGIGRARPADDVHKQPPNDSSASPSRLGRVTSNTQRRPPSTEPQHSLRAKASFNRSTSSLTPLERTSSRTGSVHGDDESEHGIPAIGVQVPLLAMAGDVQAPTPGGGQPAHAPGIGFFNDGTGRSHHRKRSSRQEFGPPDSYGIRHDQDHQDQFEREWIKKHPQEAAREEYYNHLPKPETALSSEQLNRLVHSNDSSLSVAATPGTPGEEDALEEYMFRMSSPNKKRTTSDNVPPESPLKKTFTNERSRLRPEDALEPEPSPRRSSKFYDSEDEHTHYDGTPILAADELTKRPGSAFMHAAVVPEPHADDEYYDSDHGANSRRSSMHVPSQPSSRPGSVHGASNFGGYSGGSLHRFISHEDPHHSGMGTPLEEIEEYEPLFPEGEDGKKEKPKAIKKRPDLAAMHHFPSQDVWEDTPSSLQYSATVSTPELERQQEALEADKSQATKPTFETPEQEQERQRGANKATMQSDKKTFLKPQFKSAVADEVHRPAAHRFPSSDTWEDTPSSLLGETTVSTPEFEEAKGIADSQSSRPNVPARPERPSRLANESKPGVTSPPSIPDKPKPTIPARPQRPAKNEAGEGAPLEQSRSAGSDETVTSPPLPKAKPAVPARPGSKISALQAGFMNDLNNRLKLGPQGQPPKKEAEPEVSEETEKAPLVDARKSRAKGPPRRKPAASPASDRKSSVTFAMSPLVTVWTIDEEDELKVQAEDKENRPPTQETEKILEENEQSNTESAAPASDVAAEISKSADPVGAAGRHSSSQADLEQALAKAGAGPASMSRETSKDIPEEAVDDEAQTGETEIKTTLPTGEQESMTVLQGAKAPEEGDVVVKDAKEELATS